MKKLNNFGITTGMLIIIITVGVILIGILFFILSRGPSFDTGEEKADHVMSILTKTNTGQTEPKAITTLAEEVSTYGGKHETLNEAEREIYARNAQSTLTTYSQVFYEATYEKVKNDSTTTELQTTTTVYKVTLTSNDTLFAHTQLVTITTAFIDGNWRIVNFTVEKAA